MVNHNYSIFLWLKTQHGKLVSMQLIQPSWVLHGCYWYNKCWESSVQHITQSVWDVPRGQSSHGRWFRVTASSVDPTPASESCSSNTHHLSSAATFPPRSWNARQRWTAWFNNAALTYRETINKIPTTSTDVHRIVGHYHYGNKLTRKH